MIRNASITTRTVCLGLAVLVVLSLFIGSSYLTVTNTGTDELLFIAQMEEGDTFSISHIHSLHQTPVVEGYMFYNGGLMLAYLEFESVGAGLPDTLDYGQTLTNLEGGGMRIDNFNKEISDLHLLIGYNTYHTLQIKDQSIPLQNLDESGQSIRFTFRQLNIWQRIYFLILLG
jgi:hypothetical protein